MNQCKFYFKHKYFFIVLFNIFLILPVKAVTISSVTDGVAYVDVSLGSDINDAFDLLETYIADEAMVNSGVVNVISSTIFESKITTKNNTTLNIFTGVELTLNASDIHHAINLTDTINSGVTGGGTLNLDGNTIIGIYANRPQNIVIGNPGGPINEPLSIIGWRQGIGIYSSATLAASNVRLENLEVKSAHTENVAFPITISNRPGSNGLWVNGATLKNVLVNGSDVNGLGGEFSPTNEFTADQIALQGVWNATLENVTSLYGGENNITISWGSKNITVDNSIAEFADAHGFNIGGGSYAVDVVDTNGFTVGMILKGETSNALATVWKVFPPDRIWIEDAANARFQTGETISLADGTPAPSTTIVTPHLTSNITLTNVIGENNAQNAANHTNIGGDPAPFADFYIQQASNVSLSGIAKSLGRTDLGAEHYGVFVGSSTYTLGNMTYEEYGSGQIPVSEFGDSSALALNQGESIVNSASTGGAIVGTNNHDIFNASIIDDSLQGRGGNDLMDGKEGNDILDGGSGFDMINGDSGNDQIYGGSDDDQITGGDGLDVVDGGPGNDYIDGGNDVDTLNGNDGNDLIIGGDGKDIISGGNGQDTINGNEESDTIDGNEGNDILMGDLGNDIINGGSDNDTIDGGEGDDQIDGGLGIDNIVGGLGNDKISGGGDNDIIDGGDGIDDINGNSGDDKIKGGDMSDILTGDSGKDNMFGGEGNDSMSGGDHNDTMRGENGEDDMSGDDGNDTLIGGNDNDTLNGGNGNDRLYGNSGIDHINGQAGNDIIYAGTGEDVVSGGSGSDRINGNGDNDTLDGNDDNDFIFGGGGNDLINGGNGDDSIYGQAGNDDLIGSLGNDLLSGGGGDDTMNGSDGEDRLFGSQGNDTLIGGNGNDLLHGGNGDDILDGKTDDDTLIGYAGNDTLKGGTGNDSLRGSSGNDILTGNAGTDRFIFGNDWGNDIITDFSPYSEIMDMRSIGLSGIEDLTITLGPGDSGVLISYQTNSIFLENRVLSQIDSSDFLF